jgi:hypothetical protein
MPLREKLESMKGVETVWGKIIPEKEAYKYALRQISAFSANLFQVMRILEPDFEKRTDAICSVAHMMNIAPAKDEESHGKWLREFRDKWNIPEFCEQSSWLGGLIGDGGDEDQNMSGRVIQFTPDRVEKELDTCPWDIVGAELCNMTTSMFSASFDMNGSTGMASEMALDMCEARGCGDVHCRVVAERKSVFNRADQGWLDHMGQPVAPVRQTPRERMVKECQALRNGQYWNAFGEANSMEKVYYTAASKGWIWSVVFVLMAVRKMATSPEEFERVFKIVFSTAGKNQFIDPFAKEGLRGWLGVPHEIGWNDGRLMGGYIKAVLDTQFVSTELEAFDASECRIRVSYADMIGRLPVIPTPEIAIGYEALWHNGVKTLVSPEWSCWFERDDDVLDIVVARKIDKKMI